MLTPGLRFPLRCPCRGQIHTPQALIEPEIQAKKERAVAFSVIRKKAIKPFEIICALLIRLQDGPNCQGEPALRQALRQIDSALCSFFGLTSANASSPMTVPHGGLKRALITRQACSAHSQPRRFAGCNLQKDESCFILSNA